MPPAIERQRVLSISQTSAWNSASIVYELVALELDDELGAVLAVPDAEQLGDAGLGAGALAGE